MSRQKKIALICTTIVALFPLKVTCGSPQYACAVPPVPPSTEASYTYEVEPLIIYLLEWVVPVNPPIYYYSGRT